MLSSTKHMLDDTLRDLRTLRPAMSEDAMGDIIAREMRRFEPGSESGLGEYLAANRLMFGPAAPEDGERARTGRRR